MVTIDFAWSTLSSVPERLPEVWRVLAADPLLYLPLIAWWFIFELFFLLHKSDTYQQKDVLDNGVSSFYAGFYISPWIQGGAFAELAPSTVLSVILMGYGMFLILAAFVKLLPKFLIPLFGGASTDLVVNVTAIFVVDAGLPLDWATIAIVAAPVLLFRILGFIIPKRDYQ
ncbi:MAG: hypothetical protein Q8R04_05945 [Nanoarchaeota archaeon]|nr:hypothetical protein [Nanoarchaeota archaeon]